MSETSPPQEVHVQPLMNQRKFKRFVIALIAAAVIIIAFVLVQTVRDVDLPRSVDTVGWIAAVRTTPTGSQAVLIKPDGTLVESKGYRDGVQDRDLVWRPDGNRVFFTSNRVENPTDKPQVNLFRWNPGSGKIERRTATQGSYVNLAYSSNDESENGLVALAGKIVEFDPVTGDTTPILPPRVKSEGSSEGGRVDPIEGSYLAKFGSSFKSAAWFGPDRKFIVAIMKGENGETMVLQDMTPVNGMLLPPLPLAAGNRIDMDVSRATGAIVLTEQGFRFPDPDPKNIPPEFVKNGKVVRPYQHRVAIIDPRNLAAIGGSGPKYVQPQPIVQSENDMNVFGMPTVSPDGKSVVLTVGVYEGGEMRPVGVLKMAAQPGGAAQTARMHKGAITGISFSGDGRQLVYTERAADGTSTLHVMDSDGQNDHAVAEGKGSFTQAAFSPQVKG